MFRLAVFDKMHFKVFYYYYYYNVLKCPLCGKQCEFLSLLLSYIHIGSNCLQQLVNTSKVKVEEADLSIDLSPVLGVPEADRDRIIQCSSCK